MIFNGIRVDQTVKKGAKVIEDGSYLYRKYRSLLDAGEDAVLSELPSIPITGWSTVNEDTHQTIEPTLPAVTSSMV